MTRDAAPLELARELSSLPRPIAGLAAHAALSALIERRHWAVVIPFVQAWLDVMPPFASHYHEVAGRADVPKDIRKAVIPLAIWYAIMGDRDGIGGGLVLNGVQDGGLAWLASFIEREPDLTREARPEGLGGWLIHRLYGARGSIKGLLAREAEEYIGGSSFYKTKIVPFDRMKGNGWSETDWTGQTWASVGGERPDATHTYIGRDAWIPARDRSGWSAALAGASATLERDAGGPLHLGQLCGDRMPRARAALELLDRWERHEKQRPGIDIFQVGLEAWPGAENNTKRANTYKALHRAFDPFRGRVRAAVRIGGRSCRVDLLTRLAFASAIGISFHKSKAWFSDRYQGLPAVMKSRRAADSADHYSEGLGALFQRRVNSDEPGSTAKRRLSCPSLYRSDQDYPRPFTVNRPGDRPEWVIPTEYPGERLAARPDREPRPKRAAVLAFCERLGIAVDEWREWIGPRKLPEPWLWDAVLSIRLQRLLPRLHKTRQGSK